MHELVPRLQMTMTKYASEVLQEILTTHRAAQEMDALNQKDTFLTPSQTFQVVTAESSSALSKACQYDLNMDRAHNYLLDHVNERDDAEAWFEYASFCFRSGKNERGIEILKDIIAERSEEKSDAIMYTYLAYAARCIVDKRNDEALSFSKAAVSLKPKNPLPRIILV